MTEKLRGAYGPLCEDNWGLFPGTSKLAQITLQHGIHQYIHSISDRINVSTWNTNDIQIAF